MPRSVRRDARNALVKILITGGTGFIGRYFHELLTRQGHELVILDLWPADFDLGKATFIKGDVRDPATLARAIAGCDRVLHLAAAHHDFGIAHDTYYDVNEKGSQVVCDEADKAGVKEICFYSSVAVYGDVPEPRREGSDCKPTHPYGGSKLAGEKVFEKWVARGGGRRCLIIRPTITFGPRNYANMYSLIRQVKSGKFVRVGGGTNIKSLSYVENIVAFTDYIWNKPGRPDLDAYNWVEKPDLDSRHIAEQIMVSLGRKPSGFHIPMWLALGLALPFDAVIKVTGKNLPISSMRVKKFAAMQTKFEADKAQGSGFKPPVSLPEGIDRMTKWYLAEGMHKQPVWRQPPAEVMRG
jgi:GlcNAc-P-P-Und epimerase